jgi:hypothetical protein
MVYYTLLWLLHPTIRENISRRIIESSSIQAVSRIWNTDSIRERRLRFAMTRNSSGKSGTFA